MVVLVSCFVAIALFFVGSYSYFILDSGGEGASADKYDTKELVTKEIMLFGDSLIGVPATEYKMGEMLEADIEKAKPDYDAAISISFGNGDTAKDLYSRVDEDVLNRKDHPHVPNAIIVLFDTDAADVNEEGQSEVFRKQYENKLDALMTKLVDKIEYVALAGPILKGEKKEGENVEDNKLDAYEAINKKVSSKHKVAYIPLREKFQAEEDGYDQEAGHLTQDGQHPKRAGEEIIEEAFKKQILSWDGLWSGETTRLTKFDAPESLETLVKSLRAKNAHEECIKRESESKCKELEAKMKLAEDEHLNVLSSENGMYIPKVKDETEEPVIEEAVDEAIEEVKETDGNMKNINYSEVKEKVHEAEKKSEVLAKKSSKKFSTKSKKK